MSNNSNSSVSPGQPNIVVILADDMGFGDVGCYNPDSRIPTPNMDALAGRGVLWTDMHTPSAVCTPSRYGMLTGRYAWRDVLPRGVLYGYEPPLIPVGTPTLASRLTGAGYQTACVGKWHLGLNFSSRPGMTVDFGAQLPWKGVDTELEQRIDLSQPMGGGPIELGFDTFFGTAGCATAQPPFAFIEGDRFVEQPTIFRPQFHFTGRPGMTAPGWDDSAVDPTFTARATQKIRELSGSESPFFLYLAASAPHEPCLEQTVPDFARGMSRAGHRGDLVWLFDWMVGEVVRALETAGVADDTLLVVTSDNGALPGDRVNEDTTMAGYELYDHKSCGDWRGYKAHIWEGGHRVPFIVGPAASAETAMGRHPASPGPGGASPGSVETQTACLTDLFETLPSLAGAPAGGFDSIDLSGCGGFREWSSPSGVVPVATVAERTALIHHSGFGVFSVRSDRWKLIVGSTGSGGWPPPYGSLPNEDESGQLYDLENDPGEAVNLYGKRPGLVGDLLSLVNEFRQGKQTVLPTT